MGLKDETEQGTTNQQAPSLDQQTTPQYEIIPDSMRGLRTIESILKKTKTKPAFKRGPTVFQALKNIKDKYNPGQETGVYRIFLYNNNTGTNEVYIGTMRRNLNDRIEEHKRDIKQGKLTTALARRAYESDVNINWMEAKVIQRVDNWVELRVAEKVSIYRESQIENVINDKKREAISEAWKCALTK